MYIYIEIFNIHAIYIIHQGYQILPDVTEMMSKEGGGGGVMSDIIPEIAHTMGYETIAMLSKSKMRLVNINNIINFNKL